jgi:PIN domain nuclease of toxin-antitoxin system
VLISDLDGPASLVLDTHIWVWASGGRNAASRFKKAAARSIEQAAGERRLIASAASVWEIALKIQKDELLISGDLRSWVRDQVQYPGIRIIPMNSSLAIDATSLPEWIRRKDGRPHKDPADRFIVSEARRRNAVLITCDSLILDYARQGHLIAFDARV